MELAEAERLARAVFDSPGYGQIVSARENDRAWSIVFDVDTLDNPMFLVDKRTGHVDVGTVFPPEVFDEIAGMRSVIDRPWRPPWADELVSWEDGDEG